MLVEADGCRLFYTGDIRGHGRKAGIFEELLRTPPKDIDVMLTEGTNVRSEADVEDEETTSPESDVERARAQLFRDTQGMALAMYSAQNIDRLVTLFRAAKRSGRTFIMTLYGMSIVEATGNSNIPGAGWPQVRVYVPGWQQAKVKKSGAFERVDRIRPFRVFVGPRRYSADFFHTRSSTCASPSAAFSSSTSSSSRRTCGFEPGRPPSAHPYLPPSRNCRFQLPTDCSETFERRRPRRPSARH